MVGVVKTWDPAPHHIAQGRRTPRTVAYVEIVEGTRPHTLCVLLTQAHPPFLPLPIQDTVGVACVRDLWSWKEVLQSYLPFRVTCPRTLQCTPPIHRLFCLTYIRDLEIFTKFRCFNTIMWCERHANAQGRNVTPHPTGFRKTGGVELFCRVPRFAEVARARPRLLLFDSPSPN